MGSITTGIGLISGIDTASLIESLIALESRPKLQLQSRIGNLQAQKTALLDVNARLLNLKNASRRFRLEDIFQSARATSSDETIATATANARAQPGSHTFIVKQLVSTSQYVTKGYASRDNSPLGLSEISFEFGNGRLSREVLLEELNGGAGVDRGRIVVTDRAGAEAEIDLRDATSLNEVIERINADTTIAVTASFGSQGLVLTDTSGGAGTLSVESASGDTTAEDLGLDVAAVGTTLTGADVWYLGGDTALSTLNDGNGALVRNNVADLRITARDGTVYDVDLGRIDEDITTSTLLSELNNGAGITIDSDVDAPDLTIVARDGTEYEVDLTGITTVGGLITRIQTETSGVIALSITDGDHFTLTDSSGGTGRFKVLTTDTNKDAAEELGLLEEDGVLANTIEGEVVPSTIDEPAATTLQEIIDRIEAQTSGHITAAISGDGQRLEITDTVSGGGNLIVRRTAANDHLASQLGIETSATGVAADTLSGTDRVLSGLGTTLVKSINGGAGLDGATEITITDRDGDSHTYSTLDQHETISDLIDALNADLAANGVDVTLSLNDAGNGLKAVDASGGSASNFKIEGDGAAALGLTADTSSTTVTGENAQLQYVSVATPLSALNYGRGIGNGVFRIRDAEGNTADITINGTEKTVYDVISEINSAGGGALAITARINDTGDGILLESTSGSPSVPIKVTSLSGTAAKDLRLLGEADEPGDSLDGSYERTVDLDTGDTLDEVVAKIRAADVPVTVSVVNTGNGAAPFRLNVTSQIAGRSGELVIDAGGVDLGLNRTTEGKDAKVFYGAEDPENAFLLTSSTNVLEDVIDGLTVNLVKASDDPIRIDVERDTGNIVAAVKQMVTTFNDVIGRIDDYDYFNVDTEERGVLLGNATTASVRSSLFRVATGRALNVDGSYQYLTQIGISFDREGSMRFDESKFREAYEADPESVEALIAEYDVTTSSTEEVAAGITVNRSSTTYNALGFANLFDRLLDQLTNSVDGLVTRADEAFESQIDLLEDRVGDIDARLELRRESLQRQFIALEESLARLQSQQGALASFSSVRTTQGG